MGTRHLIAVISDGEYKVAQYGQWDGYPSGQGDDIVNFILTKMDLPKFKKAVSECEFLVDEEISNRWKDFGADGSGFVSWDDAKRFGEKYPELSRDTGAKILSLVQDNNKRGLRSEIDFAADSLFCEWAYVLDLDNEVLEVYEGFNKHPLDKNERFAGLSDKKENEYYPVRLVKKYKFSDLNDHSMSDLQNELNEEKEEE